jgi:hypothetical protein
MFHGIRLRRPDPDPCLLQAVVPLSLVRLLWSLVLVPQIV